MGKYIERLFRPVDASSLGAFRLLFGLALAWQSYVIFDAQHIRYFFLDPQFHFSFGLFDALGLKPWPEQFMLLHFKVMGIAALAVALGFYFRAAMITYTLSFLYIFLLEKSFYNNHYYLILLLSFLLSISNADRWCSWKNLLSQNKKNLYVPFWEIFLLRMQIAVVYFYAGIAKLNGDWLFRAEPLRTWLSGHENPLVSSFLGGDLMPLILSWGGCLFDLAIPFLLIWGRWRTFAVAAVIVFNALNFLIFGNDIGVFPFVMIAALVLFGDPESPRKMTDALFKRSSTGAQDAPKIMGENIRTRRVVAAFVAGYLIVQLAVPLRHWLYPGDVLWTEEGYRFSWRMKIAEKRVQLSIVLMDDKTQEVAGHLPDLRLNSSQLSFMSANPDMLLQYIRFQAGRLAADGRRDLKIRVDALASLNGRPFVPFINEEFKVRENLPSKIKTLPFKPY